MKSLITLLTLLSFNADAKLLDKVAGVINDKIYTLSELQRIEDTIAIRKEISPFIYKKPKYSKQEVLKILQHNFVIRDKLSELGFVISDDSVDSRIKETEKGLGLSRKELLQFLKSKGISFNEYFELIRSAMEFNIFNRRIIAPLVTITDQEIKNFYYKLNSNNKALSFKYRVIDFALPRSIVKKQDISKLQSLLEIYQKTGNIPAEYNDISTSDLGTLSDEDLPKDLSKLFRQTDESKFSKAYVKGDEIHLFFIKKKDLKESKDFLAKKNFIQNKLFLDRAESISSNWLSRESLNYYVLENI